MKLTRTLMLGATLLVGVASRAEAAPDVWGTEAGLLVTGCGGPGGHMCAAWRMWIVDVNTVQFEIDNTSGNPASLFSAFGFGGLGSAIDFGNIEEWNGSAWVVSSIWSWHKYDDTPGGGGFPGLDAYWGVTKEVGAGSSFGPGDGVLRMRFLTTGDASQFGSATELAIHDKKGGAGCLESGKAIFDGADGNSIAYVPCTPTTVPEPATIVLTATGLLGLGALARRRRK